MLIGEQSLFAPFQMVAGEITIENKCRSVLFAFYRVNRSHFDAILRCIDELVKPIAFTLWLYRLGRYYGTQSVICKMLPPSCAKARCRQEKMMIC